MTQDLKHQALKVIDLIEDYRAGKIVVPEFQRDYVWRPNKAPVLLDSLYQRFPISSLLLWQSSNTVKARPAVPQAARTSQVNWLIDGQQRVRTLEKIYAAEEIVVVFNPEIQQFRLANSATQKDRNWIRVVDIWEDAAFRLLRRQLDNTNNLDRWEERLDAVRNILNYEVPAVCMTGHIFDQAVLAFERINTMGAKLKSEDVLSAKVAAKHTGFIADEVVPFRKILKDKGFERINVMHLFRACAFVAMPDGRSRTPLHELEAKAISTAWKKTKVATEQAIGLISSELGLFNMNILWSGSLLVPLIAICARQNSRERDVPGMMGWLALAALGRRYSGASETALDQDLRACKDADPIRALLRNLKEARGPLKAVAADFSGALADRSGLLTLYIACKHRGILDFSGTKILSNGNIDQHHILPRAQFATEARHRSDNLANIAFISGQTNKSINATGPEVYLKKIAPSVLQSQCIPMDESIWKIDACERFWSDRRELLAAAFNDFVKASLPSRRLEQG